MLRKHSIALWFVSLAVSSNTTIVGELLEPEPAGYVDCPLCADSTHVPQDEFSIFVSGPNTLTCQTAFELGTLRLPEENCTFWQSRGSTICQCAAGPPPENNCTLCEDVESLPFPSREGSPGKLCAQLQVLAKRDSPELCMAWQQSFGVYCGCQNPIATAPEQQVCRLCGGDISLPGPNDLFPLLTENDEEISSSCGELEFSANIPGASCQQYRTLSAEECCRNVVLPAIDEEDDTAGAFSIQWMLSCLAVSTVFFSLL